MVFTMAASRLKNKFELNFGVGVMLLSLGGQVVTPICGFEYATAHADQLTQVETVQPAVAQAAAEPIGEATGEGPSSIPLSIGGDSGSGAEKHGEELLNDSSAVDCVVEVRAIKAFQRGADFRAKRLQTGRMLVDVKSQLEPLPFKRYQVLESFLKRVSLNEQVSFDLIGAEGEANYLVVRPESLFGNRVQVMVNWKDEAGADLLSTELKVINNQNVVLGTDRAEDRSTILSIKLSCD